MVFSSLTFLTLFLPITFCLYFLRGNIRWRNGVLLVVSLVFYAWSEPIWIIALILSTMVNYGCALMIDAGKRRRFWLVTGIAVSLALLFYVKYFNFVFGAALGALGYEVKPVVMPIGVSFYTFQILTYTVDVYRRKTQPQRNPLRLLLYVSCFPQLVAGPIVQYSDVAAAIGERETSMEDFIDGMKRFAVGLGKKVLLANLCGAAMQAMPLDGAGASLSFVGAWYAALMYTLQIFFDFSAYSDMAIGLGRIFGFRYKENFDSPYLSTSVGEFWRRWHISLGSFFREYVYIPLGGNRKGMARTILNLLIVWSLTGLWHGASWNFVLWGLYYGVLLVLERFVFPKLPKLPGWAATMVLVMLGWMLFYYTDIGAGMRHISAMLGLGGVPITDVVSLAVMRKYGLFPLVACLCALPVGHWLRGCSRSPMADKAISISSVLLLTGVLALSIICLVGQNYNPFIYFRF